MHRRRFLATLIAAPFAARSLTASAGGWATTRLLDPVPEVVAGESFTIRFGLYPHDMQDRSVNGQPVSVALKHRQSGDISRFSLPKGDADASAYEIELRLDKPGAYKWSIQVGPYQAMPMPTLHVVEPGAHATPVPANAKGEVTAEIAMQHEMYMPASVTIVPGEAIRWTNSDSMVHQVAWTSIDLDDSALIEPGDKHIVTFTTPGNYSYYCGPHPWMTGVVEVRS